MMMDCHQQQQALSPATHPNQNQSQNTQTMPTNNNCQQAIIHHNQNNHQQQHQHHQQNQFSNQNHQSHHHHQQQQQQQQQQVQYATKCHSSNVSTLTNHHQQGQFLQQQQQHHSYHQTNPQQQIYQTGQVSPASVNAPPTPPSEELHHHLHHHHQHHSQQQYHNTNQQVYLNHAAQGADSRCSQTGEWVMQTIQIQQQQPAEATRQSEQYCNQRQQQEPPNAISNYYYDIDDGFSDIMSAPGTPEPQHQQQMTTSCFTTNDQYNEYLPYNNNGDTHVQIIEQRYQPHQNQTQNQNQFLNQQQQQHSYQPHHQVIVHEQSNRQQQLPSSQCYSVAMSPDSSSLSTTSSSPSDHSLYQASPRAMPSFVGSLAPVAAQRPPKYRQPLSPPVVDSAPQQQARQTTTTTTTNSSQQVVLEPIGSHRQPQQQLQQQPSVRPLQLQQQQPQQQQPPVHHRSSPIHLWEFLKELLQQVESGCADATIIRWLDRQRGVFKIEDSVRVAKLWGKRKNKPKMNYDKLSRSIRQYYKKGIMKKTDRSQRLVYQFCSAYCH